MKIRKAEEGNIPFSHSSAPSVKNELQTAKAGIRIAPPYP